MLSQKGELKKLSQEGGCKLDDMCEILGEIKKGDLERGAFKSEQLRRYFPKSYTPRQMSDVILKLLDQYGVTPDQLHADAVAARLANHPPVLKNMSEITQHPNYKYTFDYNKKYTFDIEKYLNRRMKLKKDEIFDVVEA